MVLIELFVQVGTLLSIIVAILTYAGGLRQKKEEDERRAQEDRRRAQEDKRKAEQATIEAYRWLMDSVLSEIDILTPGEVVSFVNETKSEEYKHFRKLLMHIDCFCIGLNEGIYDFDVFYELAKDYFDSERGSIKPTIMAFMDVKNKERKYYRNTFQVWERMAQKRKTLGQSGKRGTPGPVQDYGAFSVPRDKGEEEQKWKPSDRNGPAGPSLFCWSCALGPSSRWRAQSRRQG